MDRARFFLRTTARGRSRVMLKTLREGRRAPSLLVRRLPSVLLHFSIGPMTGFYNSTQAASRGHSLASVTVAQTRLLGPELVPHEASHERERSYGIPPMLGFVALKSGLQHLRRRCRRVVEGGIKAVVVRRDRPFGNGNLL